MYRLLSARRMRSPAGRWWRAILLVLLLALPLGAIVSVAVQQWTAPAGSRDSAPAVPASPSDRPVLGNAVWQPTSLQVETDALVAVPGAPGHLFAGTSTGIWSSPDSGATWQHADTGEGGAAVLALTTNAHAGTFAGDGNGVIYRWEPAPASRWRRISGSLSGSPIFSLAAAPTGSPVLLAGTVGGLFRGTPAGGAWHWQRVARTGDSSVTSIVWDLHDIRQAFASVFAQSPPVLRSRDRGATWQAAADGLPSSLPTESLLLLPGSATQLLLSTMGGGVWQWTPGGVWSDISKGLPERHAMPLLAGRDVIYAATMGSGVYMRYGNTGWQLLDKGLVGGQYIGLALALTPAPHHYLLVGTGQGVYRYALSP